MCGAPCALLDYILLRRATERNRNLGKFWCKRVFVKHVFVYIYEHMCICTHSHIPLKRARTSGIDPSKAIIFLENISPNKSAQPFGLGAMPREAMKLI